MGESMASTILLGLQLLELNFYLGENNPPNVI